MNENICNNDDLAKFCRNTNLIDTVGMLNPSQSRDPTYLYGSQRIDYIFITSALAAISVKAGHHQFDQHFISYHKGVYLQFMASDLFDTEQMDKTNESYRQLRMGRRDIVDRYVKKLEQI